MGGVGDHVTDVHLRTGVQGDTAVDASIIEEVKLQVLHKVAFWITAVKREEGGEGYTPTGIVGVREAVLTVDDPCTQYSHTGVCEE